MCEFAQVLKYTAVLSDPDSPQIVGAVVVDEVDTGLPAAADQVAVQFMGYDGEGQYGKQLKFIQHALLLELRSGEAPDTSGACAKFRRQGATAAVPDNDYTAAAGWPRTQPKHSVWVFELEPIHRAPSQRRPFSGQLLQSPPDAPPPFPAPESSAPSRSPLASILAPASGLPPSSYAAPSPKHEVCTKLCCPCVVHKIVSMPNYCLSFCFCSKNPEGSKGAPPTLSGHRAYDQGSQHTNEQRRRRVKETAGAACNSTRAKAETANRQRL